MNFLTHYIIDKTDDFYHNIGLTLPDVIVLHNRNVGFRQKTAAQLCHSDIPDDFRRMCQAMMRHFQLDKWFHGSEFFSSSVTFIQNEFHRLTGGHIAFYYAHILLEILIDRHILTIHPDLHRMFYAEYEKFNFGTIVPFLENVKNFDRVKFLDFCDLFAHSTFLYGYSDKHDIINSLHKVTRRMGLEIGFSCEESIAADAVDEIFYEMQPSFDDCISEAREME